MHRSAIADLVGLSDALGVRSCDLQPNLVTRAHSERQQRNRAFAAEFLAPMEALRQRVHTDVVPEEVIANLATESHLSSLVIRHQLENRGIARSAVA